ncbi:MAG: GNAT family N-acetyltransferase [Smithella sp.]
MKEIMNMKSAGRTFKKIYINYKIKIIHVWSRELMAKALFDRLSRLGITIVPYYLFEESKSFLNTADTKLILDKPYETIILNRSNINLIKGFENPSSTENEFSKLWDKDCSCICLTSEGCVLGYGWVDYRKCNYKYLSFELKNNEAYAFNFHTARHMRGRNIAPFLRSFLYEHVRNMGRNRIYSISEQFNTPALKFKEKINAKPLLHYVYVNLFNKISKNIKIKTMKNHLS